MKFRWIGLNIVLACLFVLRTPSARAEHHIPPSISLSQSHMTATGVPRPAAAVLKHLDRQALIPSLRLNTSARRQQVLCLALAIYQEARGQSFIERTAVAQVVFNRSTATSDSICEVIWADHGSQFQWVRHGLSAILPQETTIWQTIQTEALQLYTRRPDDITKGATHFFNPQLASPAWAHSGTVTARYTQVFIRPKNPQGGL